MFNRLCSALLVAFIRLMHRYPADGGGSEFIDSEVYPTRPTWTGTDLMDRSTHAVYGKE